MKQSSIDQYDIKMKPPRFSNSHCLSGENQPLLRRRDSGFHFYSFLRFGNLKREHTYNRQSTEGKQGTTKASTYGEARFDIDFDLVNAHRAG
jgi:hypothetical protein